MTVPVPGAVAMATTTETQLNSTMTLMEAWGKGPVLVLAILLVIFIIIGALGNLLVMIAIIFTRNISRSRSYMFIFSLALTDFLTSICVMPISLVTLLNGDFIFSHDVCEFNGYTTELFFIASIHTMMYMSVYRYMNMVDPLKGKVARWKVMVMIASAWVWSFVVSTASWRLLNHFLYKPYTTQCGPGYPADLKGWLSEGLVSITCFIIPTIVIVVMYSLVFYKAKQHFRSVSDHSNFAVQVHKQKQKLTKTFIIIVAVFLVCWSPLFGYLNYASFVHDKNSIPSLINPIVYWFGFINSAINPILYGWRTPIFKSFYRRLIGSSSEQNNFSGNVKSLGHSLASKKPKSSQSQQFSSLEALNAQSYTQRNNNLSDHELETPV